MAISQARQTSGWRFFPLAVIAALLVVVAVNAGFIWTALNSFPGQVADAFATGNGYDRILEAEARQAALGWRCNVADADGLLVVTLTDRGGHALPGLRLHATAIRPVGPPQSVPLDFTTAADGYRARTVLPGSGQWSVNLTASVGGTVYRTTRRIIVR